MGGDVNPDTPIIESLYQSAHTNFIDDFSDMVKDASNTAAFKKWSGGAPVVDLLSNPGDYAKIRQGKPVVVTAVHGSDRDFESFDPSRLGTATQNPNTNLGFFFAASDRVSQVFGENQYPVYLRFDKPFVMDARDFASMMTGTGNVNATTADLSSGKAEDFSALRARLIEEGYDGIVVSPSDRTDVYLHEFEEANLIAFHPNQIKSIFNTGEFNPQDARILHQSIESSPRGQIVFPSKAQDPIVVKLFKSADISTVLHELNHFFVNDLQQMVAAGRGGAEAKADLGTLREFAGGKFDRDGMEKIAKAYEKYLITAKAPKAELLRPFAKLRDWMARVYQNAIERLGAEPPAEIRAVFDRMLATDAQIAEAIRQDAESGHWEDALADMDAAARQRVKEKRAKADAAKRRKADSRNAGKAIKDVKNFDAVRRHIKGETSNIPVYWALDISRSEGGLDRAVVDNMIGTKAAAELAAKHGDAIFGGKADMDAVASRAGYKSVQAMLADMGKTESAEARIDREAEAELDRRSMASDALDAEEGRPGETDEQAELIEEEGEIAIREQARRERDANAGERLRRYRVGVQAKREAAAMHVGRMGMRDAVDIRSFQKAERDARKAAVRAALKGDLDEVIRQKNIELLHHFTVQECMKARELRRRIDTKYNEYALQNAIDAKEFKAKIENDYAESIKQTAATFIQPNTKLKPASSGDTLFVPSPEAGSNMEAMAPSLAGSMESWMLNKVVPDGFTGYMDLTFDQAKEVDRVMRALMEQGRGKLNAMTDLGAENLNELAAESIAPMERRPDRPKQRDDRSTWGRIQNGINKYLISLTIPENWFMAMDGNPTIQGKEAGINHKLFRKARHCQVAKQMLYQKLLAEMQPSFDGLNQIKADLESRFGGKEFLVDGLDVPEILRVGRDYHAWDADMLISIALNMGNDANMYALTEGYGFTQQQLAIVQRLFTSKQWDAIQGIWDGINSLYGRTDEVTFRLTNRHVKKEAALAFTAVTAGGEAKQMRGGYFPLVYDPLLSERAGQQQNVEDAIHSGLMYNIHQSAQPRNGQIKERMRDENGKPVVNRPQLLRTSLITRHLDAATHYITHAETLQEIDRLTRHADWKETYVFKFGEEQYRAIRNWIQDMARPNRADNSTGSAIMEKMRNLATINALGLRFKTGLKQRLGLFQAAAFMSDNSRTGAWGWKYLKRGIVEIGFGGNLGFKNEKMKWVDSLSEYMAARDGNFDREMKAMLDKLTPIGDGYRIPGTNRTVSKTEIHNAMFAWIQANDRASAYAVWIGAYEQAMDGDANFDISKMTDEQRHKEAVQYADSAAATQASSFQADLTAMQRDKGIIRFLAMFMSGNVRQGSRLLQYIDAYRLGDKSAGQVGYLAFREFAAPALSWVFLYAAAKSAMAAALGVDDDDDENIWVNAAWETAETAVAPFPLIREIPSIAQYGKADVPAVASSARAIGMGFKSFKDVSDGEYGKALADIGTFSAFFAGVPGQNLLGEFRPLGEAAGIVERKRK